MEKSAGLGEQFDRAQRGGEKQGTLKWLWTSQVNQEGHCCSWWVWRKQSTADQDEGLDAVFSTDTLIYEYSE